MTQEAALPRERGLYAVLALLLSVAFLATLGTRPLFNPDEARYAEIPREMLAGGDWVIPHINGLAYIEKPPLQYWATAVVFKLFGPSEFTARLYTALCALGSLGLVWVMGRAAGGERRAWRAAAALSGMVLFLLLGQLVTLDMSLTFYLTCALAAFLQAQRTQAPGSNRGWMLLAWGVTALGVLTKGIVAAAIPVAVLVLYSLCARDFKPWRRLHVAWGLPLFLIVSVPWHWLAVLKLDDFLQFYFVHEHFARYLTPEAQRVQPWWFFIAVFCLGSMPWILPALRVAAFGWRAKPAPGQFNESLFLWIWVAFICVFFSFSDSKLAPYILPAMPALALLIAGLPAAQFKADLTRTALLTVCMGVALGLASFDWPQIVPAGSRAPFFLALRQSIAVAAVLIALPGIFVLIQQGRDLTRATLFLGAGWCLAGLALMRGAAAVAPIYSGLELAQGIPAQAAAAPVYTVGTYDQSLPFYLNRTVRLVHYRGELDYGLKRRPEAEIPDLPDFIREWGETSQAYAIMEDTMFQELQKQGTPMHLVRQANRRVLVSRQ